MDLIEEILSSRYRFFEETQLTKSLKDYIYIYFFFLRKPNLPKVQNTIYIYIYIYILKNTNIFQMILFF